MRTGRSRNAEPAVDSGALASLSGQVEALAAKLDALPRMNRDAFSAHADVVTLIDLDGPQLCQGSAITGGLTMNGPWINLSDTPGLGITAVHGLTDVQQY